LRSVTAHLTEPCKTCSGSGLVPRARRRLPNGQIDERDVLAWPAVLCETCNGSGQVPVRVESIQERSPT
jgi:DnaJ-class molecular chaperone